MCLCVVVCVFVCCGVYCVLWCILCVVVYIVGVGVCIVVCVECVHLYNIVIMTAYADNLFLCIVDVLCRHKYDYYNIYIISNLLSK